jgi:germination protein M
MGRTRQEKLKITAVTVAIFLLAGTAAAGGWYAGRNTPASETPNKTTITPDKKTSDRADGSEVSENVETTGNITLTLYFSDDQAMYLVPETRQIAKSDNAVKAAVEELIKGPAEAGRFETVPDKMVVVGARVSDGLATIDFGQAFNTMIPSGTTGEKMFLYSIVNTVTGLEGVTRVKFLAGAATPAVAGSRTDFSNEFTRDETLIKK